MKIGFAGLGKLGLPVALAIESKGHDVIGYDINSAAVQVALSHGLWVAESVDELVRDRDLVFVAIQTPHDPRFEGTTRLPEDRKDFDYTYLRQGIAEIAEAIRRTESQAVLSVISTVLPGTIEREIKPLLDGIRLVYNPSFITMGHVAEDFLNPEFVLVGVDDPDAAALLERFYQTITDMPIYRTSVRNAELIKVAYNTALTARLVFTNTMMELCHKTGCDVDAVMDALKLSTRRIISSNYMTPGMGEGGPCRPRDSIALSWLARQVDLKYDFFEALMKARDAQAEWIADLMCEYDLPKIILGTAYKEDVDIKTGSPALLVKSILDERGQKVWTGETAWDGALPVAVYLIGNRRQAFQHIPFPKGSVVIDPWRMIPDQEGVTVIGLGRARDSVLPQLQRDAVRTPA